MSSQYPHYPRTGQERQEPTQATSTPASTEQTRGGAVAQRFDDATSRAGRRVEEMGHKARERITTAADTVAEKAQSVGSFLQERDIAGMADDVADVIRRYPVQSVLVGLGAGFMLGRMTSR
ncbi:MAG TPA: hypothetical protein VFB62_17695 [Polyangiaceae bacterium]|jgi:ElaB/YqjD/DUF883 family membrane-anchored ribosome-binding protein|nr:hypothetical protein [Polyangiaceae bacterium]